MLLGVIHSSSHDTFPEVTRCLLAIVRYAEEMLRANLSTQATSQDVPQGLRRGGVLRVQSLFALPHGILIVLSGSS